MVLRVSGLTHVKVFGGDRLADGYVVTDSIKGHVVQKLKAKNLCFVAVGDGLVDVDVLRKADEVYIVVGDKATRSKSMNVEPPKLVAQGVTVRQVLLTPAVEPRLDAKKSPIIEVADISPSKTKERFVHATNMTSAKLLISITRDAAISGRETRKAHKEIDTISPTSS